MKSAKLLFKDTRDGASAGRFHEICDHKGPTLTLVQEFDTYTIFGAFTDIPWDNDDQSFGSKQNKLFLMN